jgi:hypothetical protein
MEVETQLTNDLPTISEYHYCLALSLGKVARLLVKLKDFANARRMLENAIPHYQAALKGNPRNSLYRQDYRQDTTVLAAVFCHLLMHAEAATTARRLAEASADSPKDLYNAACVFSRCVPLVEKDVALPMQQRKHLIEIYGEQATGLLKQAVVKGYKGADRFRKDTDLDAIRSREDFKKLLASLKGEMK